MAMERSEASVLGGITEAERQELLQYGQLWQQRHLRTAPIEREAIVPGIEALYRSAGLPRPRIVIVPSPGVLAFAGTFASALWHARSTRGAAAPGGGSPAGVVADCSAQSSLEATCNAVLAATETPDGSTAAASLVDTSVQELIMTVTYAPADVATANATDFDTHQSLYDVVEDLTSLRNAVSEAMQDPFGNSTPTDLMMAASRQWGAAAAARLFDSQAEAESALASVGDWFRFVHAGNAGAYWDYRIGAYRDVLGLRLPEHAAYAPWEACAIHGSYRYLHERFCILSDFPCEITERDGDTIAAGSGPLTYRWRDGWVV